MKITLTVKNQNFYADFENSEEEHRELSEFAIMLYNIIPPTSAFYDPLIKDISERYPEIYKEFIKALRAEEPLVPPESIF